MKNMNIDQLGAAIGAAMNNAAADYIIKAGRQKTVDLDALVVALRKRSAATVAAIMDQGKALVDGGMSGWLGQLVAVEAAAAGIAAAKEVIG